MEFKNAQNASLVKKSIEPSLGRHASESSYAHFFELDKTRNNESMFETSRHDMSISTEIHRPTGGNEEVSEHNQVDEDHTGGSVINTQSPTSARAKSIDDTQSPTALENNGGSNCSTNERHILNRTTNNSKRGSMNATLPHFSND